MLEQQVFSAPILVLLGQHGMGTARKLQALYPQALIYGLYGRVTDCDRFYEDFGGLLRQLYQKGHPIIALCAAGIVIRSLATVLGEKDREPPVLAIAEDGSSVVPLLGGLAGANRMARAIAQCLGGHPAITTSGELRFGTCLLSPPAGYVLPDLEQGKRFVSDLLAGETLCVEGAAQWLTQAQLPIQDRGSRQLCITAQRLEAAPHRLLIHPQIVLAYSPVGLPDEASYPLLVEVMQARGLALEALQAILLPESLMGNASVDHWAATMPLPVRFVSSAPDLEPLREQAPWVLYQTDTPEQARRYGQDQGSLTVVGIGPGAAELMTPAVRQALEQAQDVLGYETYLKMAGPFRQDQHLHPSDNREELQRAAHAFTLAARGRRVVIVSSGDPGVFAMASAVFEALEQANSPSWYRVRLQILPGISAAFATAAKIGAPLGHDFCLISLSDNLKPWSVIEQRLEHAAAADFVMAFYNPISKARPWQLGEALAILRRHRSAETWVVLGRDVGRPAESVRVLTLGALSPEQVDMRTLVIVGSSTTRCINTPTGQSWVYTPRWYA